MNHQYHVSSQAAGIGNGSQDNPFGTIQQAADVARAGDEIIVHEGVYRESVDPQVGGESDTNRIVYRAALGETRPVITGSERVDTWTDQGDGVWKVVLSNKIFGSFNPFIETVFGDWTVYPDPSKEVRHLGDVFLNGKSFYEVSTAAMVRDPQRRVTGLDAATGRTVDLVDPEATANVWACQVDDTHTTIWANFHEFDPNQELVEASVRRTCFYPNRTFVNYITVRGFEMAQAACPYAPPTAEQVGLLGPHWSRGWIIENNIIHDAKCSAISLGKELSTGDNESTRTHRKSGYQYQMEAVYKAMHVGWSKEVIGSHVVRNNIIFDCGQNAVVGHMGCAFSRIEGNHIYRIGTKREFFGWEVAGIKLHAAIDTVIHGNRVHDCVLGLWLDWQAQGTRVTSNVFYRNTRDAMTEVTHGPIVFDNNVFGSDISFDDWAQGVAFVNNLFAGRINHHQVLDRSTPYHFPHTCDPAGTAFVYGGDDRYINNIFMTPADEDCTNCGTAYYNSYPRSLEDFEKMIADRGLGDEEIYRDVLQPVYIEFNSYCCGAQPLAGEKGALVFDGGIEIEFAEKEGSLWMRLKQVPNDKGDFHREGGLNLGEGLVVTTTDLGQPRIVEEYFENPDGSSLRIDSDITQRGRQESSTRGPIASDPDGMQCIWRQP